MTSPRRSESSTSNLRAVPMATGPWSSRPIPRAETFLMRAGRRISGSPKRVIQIGWLASKRGSRRSFMINISVAGVERFSVSGSACGMDNPCHMLRFFTIGQLVYRSKAFILFAAEPIPIIAAKSDVCRGYMRRMVLRSTLLAVVSVMVLVGVRAGNSQPKPKAAKAAAAMPVSYGNVDSISEEEMKIYLYFLASDQLEGRNLPSRGLDTAALYIASHLAEWGLKPGGSASKTTGPLQPYFMPMELVSKSVLAEQSKVSITAPPAAGGRGGRGMGGAGGGGARGGAATPATPRTTDFEYTKDWSVSAGGRGGPPLEALDVTGNLVFAGNGYVINKTKIDPYEGLDVKGKIVVVAGLPAELAAQQAAAAAGGGRGRGGQGGADAAAP